MAIQFNYYNFKKRNQLKYEVDIDLSGLDVKSSPTAAIIDEDTGQPTEVNLDEIKDGKINFVYTGAVSDLGNFSDDDLHQGSHSLPIPEYAFDANQPDGTLIDIPLYTVGESVLDTRLIDYGVESASAEIISEGASIGNINPTYYTVDILPRYELMQYGLHTVTGTHDNRTDIYTGFKVNLPGKSTPEDYNMTEVLAALNLWGNETEDKYGLFANGYIDKKTFDARLSSFREASQFNNIDVEVIEYPENLTENGTDLNESFLSRGTTIPKLSEAANKFINVTVVDEDTGNSVPYRPNLQPLVNDDVTPFALSIKEGFRAWFQTKEELYTEFLQRVQNLTTIIEDFPLASVFVDNLNVLGYTKIEVETPKNDIDLITVKYASGKSIQIRQTAVIRDDEGNITGTHRTYYRTTSLSTSYVYQVQESADSDLYEFVLNDDGIRVFVKELALTGTPVESYYTLKAAQEALADGISTTIAAGTLVSGVGALAGTATLFLDDSSELLKELEDTVNKIKRYESWTNESVFPASAGEGVSKYFFSNLTTGSPPLTFQNFEWDKRVARVLVPVDFGYKKSKRKRKVFGFSFTDYVYEDLGVRWVYVNLIDTSAFNAYRRSVVPNGEKLYGNSPISNWALTNAKQSLPTEGTITLTDPLDLTKLGLKIGDTQLVAHIDNAVPPDLNGDWQAEVIDETTLSLIMSPGGSTAAFEGSLGDLLYIITPYETTQLDENKTPVRIDYNIPYLPDDDSIRDLSFQEYGTFDQSEFAVRTRSGGGTTPVLQPDGTVKNIPDDDIAAGWEIFHNTSKLVEDMREGVDIYNKVNFLLRILVQEFGASRVKLIETTRSLQHQNNLQLGGTSSNFLSWHNYGLAARIMITKGNSNERIEEDTEDFWKLFSVAESFTAGAINGDYGEPCTVVWCARLVAGSDIFDWEFLPIGVGHKDAWKFRDAAYRQQDSYYANAFVNVDRFIEGNESVEVLEPNQSAPDTGAYIHRNSKAYKNGIVINNEVYVDPNKIPRYQIPSNLILKDLQEFLFLIQNRQDANGTDIGGRRTPDEWKSKNPRSFNQLVLYYGMIGNFSSARTLISGEYVRMFEQLVVSTSQLDPVSFVRAYLGEAEYQNVRITPELSADNSFITLSDGKYTTPMLEVRSAVPEGSGNTFGQAQIDFDDVEFGQYQDGVFVPESDVDNIIIIKTDEPVLSGYVQDDEGNVTIDAVDGGDAFILHSLIAAQIVESFDVVKQDWLNIDFKLMHDRITESPNARVIPVLENEFGTIMSQDLLTFDQLRDMYQRMNINSQKRYVDSGVLGIGVDLEGQDDRNEDQSVFEKLVTNAQLSGIKKVKISNETLIEDEPILDIDVEKVVDEINRRNTPTVRDIL